MKFQHRKGSKSSRSSSGVLKVVLAVLSVLSLVGGLYLLLLVLTPNIPTLFPSEEINAKSLPEPSGDKIYIPKIGVSVPLSSEGMTALEKGSWHRYPERGDPVQGGNFIVSAHRFSLGATPGQIRQKSPFYHIEKLSIGDQILVDFKGKRYGYQITEEKTVKPNQTEIEAPITNASEARMTLYTCTLKGESDGREVFFAKPLGEVINGMVEKS